MTKEVPRARDEEVVPNWKKPRLELPPDVPLSLSDIPFVQQLILANNKEQKAKKRMAPFDIINEAFLSAAQLSTNDCDRGLTLEKILSNLSAPSSGVAVEDGSMVFFILQEGVGKNKMIPRSSYLSRVLYDWLARGLIRLGLHLISFLVNSRHELPQFFATSVDEKVVCVAMRFVALIPTSEERRMTTKTLLEALPSETLRRRLFAPIFSACASYGDVCMAVELLEFGIAAGLEFWDADYAQILEAFKKDADKTSALDINRLQIVLRAMESHHPVVGKTNSELISALLGGTLATVTESHASDGSHADATTLHGVCSSCHEPLMRFDFDDGERQSFLSDIMEKLIVPRISCESHYEKEKQVTPEVKHERECELDAFLTSVRKLDYNVVIDGANVGYYGLSSWYCKAKTSLLESKGIDVSKVSYGELNEVPFPVDVAPQFCTIDDVVTKAQQLGFKPLIVLHQRHTIADRAPEANKVFLHKWNAASILVPSPAFLNDDFCWMYAAMSRTHCSVITNDLMRDHHFIMLSQRTFLRWRQSHRMTYRAFCNPENGRVSVNIVRPRPYSVWVQKSARSGRWHIPFMACHAILDQATNRIKAEGEPANEGELEKDGSDNCDGWVCTQAIH